MLSFKPGASIRGLRPEMIPVLVNLSAWGAITITSGTDGQHGLPGAPSFHYNGLALDIRTHSFPKTMKDSLVKSLKETLGDQYDVVLENEKLPNEHVHIEFDDGKEAPRKPEDRV